MKCQLLFWLFLFPTFLEKGLLLPDWWWEAAARVVGDTESPPLHFDWRDNGTVTNVKDVKGHCNADWAFAAIGALEGQLMIKNNISIELSAQELIDCSKDGNFGCEGGSVKKAFDYIIDNGISTEKTYPYNGTEADTCLNKSGEKIAKSYNIKFEVIDSESIMKETLYKHGPIIAIIDGVKIVVT